MLLCSTTGIHNVVGRGFVYCLSKPLGQFYHSSCVKIVEVAQKLVAASMSYAAYI